jgi:hypothetical protein
MKQNSKVDKPEALCTIYTGHTQKNGGGLLLKNIKTAPIFFVLPV